jgi:hypothetical protein
VRRLWPAGESVQVWGATNCPDGFHYRGQPHRIVEICNHWQIHARWWEPGATVWREYWKMVTDTGILCLIYHDQLSDGWFITQVYD